MTMLDPKAMDTAREAWIASDVATRFFSDVEEHALQAAITAYISTITPAEVGVLVDAQTEARAIETVRDWLNGGCSSWGLPSQQIETLLTALAAKDAELAAVKVSNNKWMAKWERAEAQLAAYRQSSVHPDDYEKAEAQRDEALKSLERIEVRTRSVPSDTAEDDKRDKYHANSIARRAIEAQGGENG